MKWVAREHPKIDRLACPWLIGRFVDPVREFLYVPAGEGTRVAAETGAMPCDIPGVAYGHHGMVHFEDGHEMLKHGRVICDAPYARCTDAPLHKPGRPLGIGQ